MNGHQTNKEKPKIQNSQLIGLGNNRIYPKISFPTIANAPLITYELVEFEK